MKNNLRIYRFGTFRLDPTERRLFRDGQPITLAPKLFDLLLALVRKEGLVTKDALIKLVWPNCFVAENNLTVQMSRLRRVLGEGEGGESFIETVSGRGYRFVAKISTAADAEPTRENVPEAFRAYQKGRYFWSKRSPADVEIAVRHFKQAIDIDPEYAVAYVGLADCQNLLTTYGIIAPRTSIPQIKSLINKARQLDYSCAEIWTTEGYINLFHDWNWTRAKRNLRSAIKRDPNYAVARSWYAMYLMIVDKYDEAQDEMLAALTLDPLSPIINVALGGFYFYSREYDKAVVQCREAIAIDPNFHLGYATLGAVYAQLGEYAEATKLLKKALSLSRYVETVAELAYVYARTHRTDQAQDLIRELVEESKTCLIAPFGIAIAYSGLGEADEAFRWLERAYNDRSSWMVWVRDDPRLEDLRGDRRFHDLLDRVGLSQRKGTGPPPPSGFPTVNSSPGALA